MSGARPTSHYLPVNQTYVNNGSTQLIETGNGLWFAARDGDDD